MRKLPDSFEKESWDLMIPVSTEGTIKSRRNVIVGSFTILTLYILGKSLTELRVFGLSLEGSDQARILVIGLVLIIFWLMAFVANWVKDFELNKERKLLIGQVVENLKMQKENMESRYAHVDDNHPNKATMKQVQREYERYVSQFDRTKRARLLTQLTAGVDFALPVTLGLLASIFLTVDIWTIWVAPS